MSSGVPPHLPFTPQLLPYEVPEDTTVFELEEGERVRGKDSKVAFALQGKVQSVPYPFTFNSGGFSLTSLFRSSTPTTYTGIGIHRSAVGLYEHVLAASKFMENFNKMIETAARFSKRMAIEDAKKALRKMTAEVLKLLIELKRLTSDEDINRLVGEFPLTAHKEFIRFVLFGIWEELWCVALQTAASDETAFGTPALVGAAAAVHYYRKAEAAGAPKLECCKTARARLSTVALGWITRRIPEAKRLKNTGDFEIPWTKSGAASFPGFKYTALALLRLEPHLIKKPVPPSPRYAEAYKEARICVTNVFGCVGAPVSFALEPADLLVAEAETWVQTGHTDKLGAVPHPASSAQEIWEAGEAPARVAHLLAPG